MTNRITNLNVLEVPSPLEGSVDFNELYRVHSSNVLRWAARLSGSPCDAEDIAHDVFLRAQRKLHRWQDAGGSVGTWLYRTTLRVVQERRRAARLRRWLHRATTETQSFVEGQELPGRELQRKQTAALVYRVLEALPEQQRAALIMFELEGLSGEQIASVFERPVANVWVWLHRARARFLVELQSLGLDNEALGFPVGNTSDVRRKSAS